MEEGAGSSVPGRKGRTENGSCSVREREGTSGGVMGRVAGHGSAQPAALEMSQPAPAPATGKCSE